MRTATAKLLLSSIGIAIAVPFFATALVVGAHAISLAEHPGDKLLLLALAVSGAAISVINGFGRRVSKAEGHRNRQALGDERTVSTVTATRVGL
jgi:hypothetical protein